MQPISRKETKGKEAEFRKQLDDFVANCKHYGMTNISEGEGMDSFYDRIKKDLGG